MEFFSFELKNIFIALVMFFSGCMAFQPPDPIEIQAPVSESKEVNALIQPNSLEIMVDKKGRIQFSFTNQDLIQSILSVQNNIQILSEEIKKIIKQSGGKENLKIRIEQDLIKTKDFEKIIEALRRNEIYNYKLLTTPE